MTEYMAIVLDSEPGVFRCGYCTEPVTGREHDAGPELRYAKDPKEEWAVAHGYQTENYGRLFMNQRNVLEPCGHVWIGQTGGGGYWDEPAREAANTP